MNYPIRVLFLCTHNSARSQIAEGLLRHWGKDDFEVYSAGSEPSGLHPLAVQVMADSNIDITQQQSNHLNDYIDQDFDVIITVCDRIKDICPTFPNDPERIHWSFPDPAAVEGSDRDRLQAFRKTRNEMQTRIHGFVLVMRRKLEN
ncbi:MAG: arsenate reductase ArsC [Chloroflexaceae bacterium]|nr:arsenate reductase ArsC [Chloroflexaceae bacterium]